MIACAKYPVAFIAVVFLGAGLIRASWKLDTYADSWFVKPLLMSLVMAPFTAPWALATHLGKLKR